VRTASQLPLPPILLAITYAAQLLYHHDLANGYASQAAAAAAATAAAAGAGPEQQQQQQQQQQQEVLVEPGVLAAVLGGGSVSQEQLEDAQKLMQEVQVRGVLTLSMLTDFEAGVLRIIERKSADHIQAVFNVLKLLA
jgi:hypothetical protein